MDAIVIKHMGQSATGFTVDGAVVLSRWENEPERIVFYLKENYGYDDCLMRSKVHEWLDDRILTISRTACLAACYFESIGNSVRLTDAECASIGRDLTKLHDALDRIAFVNIKKISGKSTSNNREIREHSVKNKAMLRAQLDWLRPTVIVAGGAVCWDSLRCELSLYDSVPRLIKPDFVIRNHVALISSYHPAARGGQFSNKQMLDVLLQATVKRRALAGESQTKKMLITPMPIQRAVWKVATQPTSLGVFRPPASKCSMT